MLSSSKSHYEALETPREYPQTTQKDQQRPRRCNKAIATLLLIISSAFYTNGNFFLKTVLSQGGGLFTLQFMRHSTSCVFLFFYANMRGESPLRIKDKPTAKVLSWRGLYGLVNSVCGAAGVHLIVTPLIVY